MKGENLTQKEQVVCQQTQLIEKEYINSMLDSISDVDLCNEKVLFEEPVSIPSYINTDVECKVFKVSGLNFALPLASVKGVLKHQVISMEDEKNMHDGMSVGVINNDNDNDVIQVLDLTYLIMNDITDINNSKISNENKVDILLLAGSSAGIVFEEEIDVQVLLKEDVCWRNATSDRVWLAGTVKKKGLSLLDHQGILGILNNKC